MGDKTWPYWLFFGSIAGAAALSLILPGVLGISQAKAEELVMFAFLPGMVVVSVALFKRGTDARSVAQDGTSKVDH